MTSAEPAIAVVLSFMGETLSFKYLAPLRLVCISWRNILDSCSLTMAKLDADRSLRMSLAWLRGVIERNIPRTAIVDPLDGIILRPIMFAETLKSADKIMSEHWPPHCSSRREELQMMARTARQFSGTVDLVNEVIDDNAFITQNFDIADMGLRRRMNEIATCQWPEASLCIKDTYCRDMWNKVFGAGVGEVSWEAFCARFAGTEILGDKPPNFVSHLKALMCFPEGKTVTPYAVHLLSALYGPGPQMWTNYSNLMLTHGFVGFTNMVCAKEMFDSVRDKIHRACCVLRYSRQTPDVFTITTYNPLSGECSHRRNLNPTYALPDLMREITRSGWEIALFSLDGTLDTPSALEISRVDMPLYTHKYNT